MDLRVSRRPQESIGIIISAHLNINNRSIWLVAGQTGWLVTEPAVAEDVARVDDRPTIKWLSSTLRSVLIKIQYRSQAESAANNQLQNSWTRANNFSN